MSLAFVDTDVFGASGGDSILFLDLLVESWNIDLGTFGMGIVLSRKIALGRHKRFEFIERRTDLDGELDSGLQEFLRDEALSGDATPEEIAFLKTLNVKGKQPLPIYYYRELQNLRDPVHFRDSPPPKEPGAPVLPPRG